MDRAAFLVDAGYLFAQGSIALAGVKLRRSETLLDQERFLALLKGLSAKVTGLPLLRIYWYDGTDSGPSPVHNALAFRPDVKIRLGIVNAVGQQKGVDSLIVSDLINLARNRAMSDAVLLTGDEDIRVGVQQAQEVGVRVHLVGLPRTGGQGNQSNLLQQEADTLHEISTADVTSFLTRVAPTVAPVLAPAGSPPMTLADAAKRFAAALTMADVARVLANPVPSDIDRQLLVAAAATVSSSLTTDQKRDLRKAFVAACKSR
jgi:hypothetical protein